MCVCVYVCIYIYRHTHKMSRKSCDLISAPCWICSEATGSFHFTIIFNIHLDLDCLR